MKKFINAPATAWCAMILTILVLVLTFSLRAAWWAFIDIFLFFMAAFSHLISVLFSKRSPLESKLLNTISFWLLILAIIAFIGEFIAMQMSN